MLDQYNLGYFSVTHHQLILLYKLEIIRILPLVSEVTSSQNVNSSNNVIGGGVDYDSGPYTVTFTAGQTSASVSVPINDDNMLENVEDFMVTIMTGLLPDGVTRGDPGSATVNILDNDRK